MGHGSRRRGATAALASALAALHALSCGGGRGQGTPSAPTAATGAPSPAVPSPSPSPAPSPSPPVAPQDAPVPAPSPDCIHARDHEVAQVSLSIYFLECGGERIPGSKVGRQVPVGCRLHLNATPRDGMGTPTCARSWPVWQWGPPERVTGGGGDTFTPAFTAQSSGPFWVRCIVDGVRSDYLELGFVDP